MVNSPLEVSKEHKLGDETNKWVSSERNFTSLGARLLPGYLSIIVNYFFLNNESV